MQSTTDSLRQKEHLVHFLHSYVSESAKVSIIILFNLQ